MNTIEINIKINKNVYKKWSLYFKGGDMFVAYSLEKDIKGKLKELGVNGYDMETKISEQLIIES